MFSEKLLKKIRQSLSAIPVWILSVLPVRIGCTVMRKRRIYAPLRIKKEIRGALGIIAFTEEQRNSGLFNRDAFIHFTEKLSELISGKIEAAEYADDLMVNLTKPWRFELCSRRRYCGGHGGADLSNQSIGRQEVRGEGESDWTEDRCDFAR